MEKLTAIIIANNEIEYSKLTIESFRSFGKSENIEMVLVDNHSVDGLKDWASMQNDLTFVYMDEGEERAGEILCKVMKALTIDGDVLVSEAHYMLTPYALERMHESLYSDSRIGIIGGMINGEHQYQQLPAGLKDYGEALQYSVAMNSETINYVMSVSSGPVIIKSGFLKEIDGFPQSIGSINRLLIHLAVKAMKIGYRSAIRTEAVLWNLLPGGDIVSDYSFKYLDKDSVIMEKYWGMRYFNMRYNANLVSLLDCEKDDKINVLEIGCDCGATLFEIKNRYPNANVFGCELNEMAVKVASYFVDARVCNIEKDKIPFEEKFDYVIFGDVLEHLHDPLKVINYVTTILNPRGRIVASIPNLMHISVIEDLLKGNFTYTENGLLDKTHIHMFTYNEIIRMFNAAGYDILEISRTSVEISQSQDELITRLLDIATGAERFMYEAFQYIVIAEYASNEKS